MLRDKKELQEEMCRLYSVIAEECLSDTSSIQNNEKEWADVILRNCIAICLTKSEDIDECREYIETLLMMSPFYKEIIQYISVEAAYKDAKIRRNFAEAFESVTIGSELSKPLGYGFSTQDLFNLAKLHKENRYRDKIEDLLTDCNFHEECQMMYSGDYSMWF